MIDENWKCERCGDCCRYVAGDDEWTYSTLTAEQRAEVESNMEPVKRGCKALVIRDGLSVCLNQALFGVEAKPKGCRAFARRCTMTAQVKELIEARRGNQ